MRIEAEVNLPEGYDDAAFAGTAELISKSGLKAAQTETAYDKGKFVFNVVLPNSNVAIDDQIQIRIKTVENPEKYKDLDLVSLESNILDVTYKPDHEGSQGPTQEIFYNISKVQSTDKADRVFIEVGAVKDGDLAGIKSAILNQVKLHNSTDAAPINVVGFAGEPEKVSYDDVAKQGTYSFTALLELPAFADANNYTKGAGDEVLIDNQNNYWSVATDTDATNLVNLNAQPVKKPFLLQDGSKPTILKVKAPTEDKKYLNPNSLLVEFDESVSRLSAENPTNWTLNGNNLSAADVSYIRVLDIQGQGGDKNNELLALDAVEAGKERNSVIIQLKSSAAKKYFVDGTNLLQAKSVGDWASLTDLSDNNKITTQDFLFDYVVPETKPAVGIEKQSPEQFVLTLEEVLYTDEAATEELDLANNSTKDLLKVELLGGVTGGSRVLTEDEYQITKIGSEDNTEYLLELTEDWTKLLNAPITYHNKMFKVSIGEAFDIYGNPASGKLDAKTDELQPLNAQVEIKEDTKSPQVANREIADQEGQFEKDITIDVKNVSRLGYADIVMDEPVQLFVNNYADTISPEATPSVEQDKGSGVPVPTFEYVKIKSYTPEDSTLVSEGEKVTGEIVSMSDARDRKFTVAPTAPLEAGEWKLVVRQISDDVGNTMSTEEFAFTIGTPEEVKLVDNIVNPYVVWAYADDNNEDGHDYVYVLYSRQMEVDAIRAQTYNINRKQVGQEAKITSENIVLYRQSDTPDKNGNYNYYGDGLNINGNTISLASDMPEYRGQLVKIQLPKDFIVGGDDLRDGGDEVNGDVWTKKNVLTIPNTLKAVDDGVPATEENLLFTNNGGSNVFELTFDSYDHLTNGIKDNGEIPKFEYAKTKHYSTVANFINGKVQLPDEGDSTVLEGKIAEANNLVEAAVPGTEEGQYPQTAIDAFEAAIADAQKVVDDKTATQEEIDDALAALEEAITTFENAVNPEEGAVDLVTEISNANIQFGFTTISGKYDASKVDKIELVVGNTTLPVSLENGSFSKNVSLGGNEPYAPVIWKAYKDNVQVGSGEYQPVKK